MSSKQLATVKTVTTTVLKQYANYDGFKSILFFYVLFTQSLKAKRHLRARGLTPTVVQFWKWLSQVFLLLYRTSIT